MKSTPIIFIIVIILILGGALLFQASDDDQVNLNINSAVINQNLASLPEIAVDNGDINIPDSLKVCQTVDDCAYVIDHCGYCSCEVLINVEYQIAFNESFNDLCSGYQGGVCDMGCAPSTIDCVEGVCVLG